MSRFFTTMLLLLALALPGQALTTVAHTAATEETRDFICPPVPSPAFPGGQDSLFNFISTHTHYPDDAAQRHIEGRVVVEFLVRASGKVDSVKVLQSSLTPSLDSEAVRVMWLLPDFNPAIEHGHPIDCWYFLPVTFRLSQEGSPLKPEGTRLPSGDE